MNKYLLLVTVSMFSASQAGDREIQRYESKPFPLHSAVVEGASVDVIKALVQNGYSVNAVFDDGVAPIASKRICNPDVVAFLLANKANPDAVHYNASAKQYFTLLQLVTLTAMDAQDQRVLSKVRQAAKLAHSLVHEHHQEFIAGDGVYADTPTVAQQKAMVDLGKRVKSLDSTNEPKKLEEPKKPEQKADEKKS